MFKAVINADVFKDAIEAVSTLVDEAKFRITQDGISARAVDPANVAMVAFDHNVMIGDAEKECDLNGILSEVQEHHDPQ